MADIARLIRLYDGANQASADRRMRRGQIGKLNNSGPPTVEVPGTNGRLVYVRLGGGSDGDIHAVPRGVPKRAHVYVLCHQRDGQWIAEADTSAINGDDPGGGGGPHTHRRHSGNEYVAEAELFAPGVVLPSSGLTVSIGSFRYPNGVSGETYTGGTIDLTSHVPGTANKWRWVLVGVDPSTNAAVAVSGSDFDTQAELTRAEIDNVAFDGYIPLAAIQVANGDTALTDHSRYYDARPWFVPSRGQTDYTFDLNSEGAITVTNANTGNAATAGIRLESDVSVGQLFATGENYAANGWGDAVVAVTNASGGFIWQSSNIRLQNVAGTDVVQVTQSKVGIGGTPTTDFEIFKDGDNSINFAISSNRFATLDLKADIGNDGSDDDPSVRFHLDGSAAGEIGIDDSDSDKLKIFTGAHGFLGSGITIDTSGNVGMTGILTLAPSSTSNRALIINMPSSASDDAIQALYNSTEYLTYEAQASVNSFRLRNANLGNNVAGGLIIAGINSAAGAAGPAPGAFGLGAAFSGGAFFFWADDSGNLRIGPNTPTGNTASATRNGNTFGTVVGTQTSFAAAKYIDDTVRIDPLQAVRRLSQAAGAVREFTYKSGAFNGERFRGLVTDLAPYYGMDRDDEHPQGKSLNEINLFGDLVLATSFGATERQRMQAEIEQLRARVDELERRH